MSDTSTIIHVSSSSEPHEKNRYYAKGNEEKKRKLNNSAYEYKNH